MHPNLCTICETMFTKVKQRKQIQIDSTILFADLRGYTTLSENLAPETMNELLHCFYDKCSEAVWEKEGIINKFIGDAVLAIFNFPLERGDHVQRAVDAAIELQNKCRDLKDELKLKDQDLGIGIGIHTGTATIGEVGTAYKDFTAIGPVVNLASRVQNTAASGEIVVTKAVRDGLADKYIGHGSELVELKGVNGPIEVFKIMHSR